MKKGGITVLCSCGHTSDSVPTSHYDKSRCFMIRRTENVGCMICNKQSTKMQSGYMVLCIRVEQHVAWQLPRRNTEMLLRFCVTFSGCKPSWYCRSKYRVLFDRSFVQYRRNHQTKYICEHRCLCSVHTTLHRFCVRHEGLLSIHKLLPHDTVHPQEDVRPSHVGVAQCGISSDGIA